MNSAVAPASLICLGPEEALAFVNRSHAPGRHERLQAHLDVCDACRMIVAEAAAALGTSGERTPQPAPIRTLAEGQHILGRYLVGRFVARGGMGEVYEAFDTVLGERVALKTLLPTLLDDPRSAAGIQDEVRLARKVTHANVCRILEFGLHAPHAQERVPFLTMEFLQGETLAARLRRSGRMSPGQAEGILQDIVAGLGAIHEAGIIHRDLKPENVFLVPTSGGERAVVMDFGLARRAESDPLRTGNGLLRVLAGTPAYMAPEQLEGAPPTRAFDMYALGVLAFELFTGEKPVGGECPSGRLPRPWQQVIRRCLQVDPKRRYARVCEVAAELRAHEGRGPGGKSLRAGSRRRGVALLMTASVLAAGALASLAHYEQATAVSRAGTPGAMPLPAGSVVRYTFDHSLQGWMDLRYEYYGSPRMRVQPSTARSFEGAASMEIELRTSDTFTTPTIGVYETFESRLPAGTIISYHVWIPPGDAIEALQPYVLYYRRGQLDPVWGGVDPVLPASALRPGEWNVVTHSVPMDMDHRGVVEVGMEWRTRGAQLVTVYMDAIAW